MRNLSWAFGLLLLSSCATSARLATEDARANRGAADPAAVNVYAGREIGRKYQVIGTVIAAGDGESGAKAMEELKKEAAFLGANAVVDLRLEIERGFWTAAVKASGLAVVAEGAGSMAAKESSQ